MSTSQHPLQLSDLDQEMLKKRRIWYFLALILLLISALSRQPLPLLASCFTLLIGVIPELWFRLALHHVGVSQQVQQTHLFFGEEVTLAISIENRKFLPLPWLQLDNTITPPLAVLTEEEKKFLATPRETFVSTWLLWSYQRVTQRYRLTCHTRGCHLFGPLRLRCSDPFGWLERDILLPAYETLVVYPLLVPIELLGLPTRFPLGERVGPRHVLEDPLWFAGLRAYQYGDDPRRIAWKATARAGELRSKLYESTTQQRLLILLDTWTYDQCLRGVDLDLQEFCISAAASLAVWGLDAGYAVGLLANGSLATVAPTMPRTASTDSVPVCQADVLTPSLPGVGIPFALEDGQYVDILTTLARLVPAGYAPWDQVIDANYTLFSQGTTLLWLGSFQSLRTDVLVELHERQLHGCSVILVLVDKPDACQHLPALERFPVYFLGGKEQWHELLRSANAQPQISGAQGLDGLSLG